MPLQEHFIKNLRRYREELGCSQEQVGNKLGTDRTVISRYERSSSRMTLERADALARALEVDVRVLFDTPEGAPFEPRSPAAPVSSRLVGEKVRDLRIALGLSQRELGIRTGLDRNHVSRIESPRDATVALQLATLEKLANALGVNPSALI